MVFCYYEIFVDLTSSLFILLYGLVNICDGWLIEKVVGDKRMRRIIPHLDLCAVPLPHFSEEVIISYELPDFNVKIWNYDDMFCSLLRGKKRKIVFMSISFQITATHSSRCQKFRKLGIEQLSNALFEKVFLLKALNTEIFGAYLMYLYAVVLV